MTDLSDKGSESEEMSSHSQIQIHTPDRASSDGSNVKTCVDCGTSKTPLWRGGPAGPKSLCNACGIRSRKKRRALLGISSNNTKGEDKKTKKCNKKMMNQSDSTGGSTSSSEDSTITNKIGNKLKLKNRLWAFGKDVALQRPRSNTTQRRRMGEEEQAAFLLMALSCGSVYA